MKFIHTSDWQLGMPFKNIQGKGDALRKARIDVVKQILALAEREKVDFVIAAGDLFDNNMIEPDAVTEVAVAISRSTVPVYLLTGNHDPLDESSPYVRCKGLFKDSAIVLTEEKPIKINGGTIYPCPTRVRNSSKDPTKWIPLREEGDGIRIGIAHGSVGLNKVDFPIEADAPAKLQLDYLALGHFHDSKEINPRMWYSGAPECTNFGQGNTGNVLQVEISAAGALPKVMTKRVACFEWSDLERHVNCEDDVTQIVSELDSLANAKKLIRLKIDGTLPQEQMDVLEKLGSEKLFHLQKEINVVLGQGAYKYKHGLLAEMTKILAAKADSQELSPESSRRAISRLHTFVNHSGFTAEDL